MSFKQASFKCQVADARAPGAVLPRLKLDTSSLKLGPSSTSRPRFPGPFFRHFRAFIKKIDRSHEKFVAWMRGRRRLLSRSISGRIHLLPRKGTQSIIGGGSGQDAAMVLEPGMPLPFVVTPSQELKCRPSTSSSAKDASNRSPNPSRLR